MSVPRLRAAALLMDVAFFCAWAAVPFLVKTPGPLYLGDGELGTLRALASALYIAGNFLLAPLWDRCNKARLARGSALLVGGTFILASRAGGAWQLFILLPAGGLFLSAFWPTLLSLVGEARGPTLAGRIGRFNVWWSSGKAAAFVGCGTLLFLFGSPEVVLLLCGLLMLLVAFLAVPRGAVPRQREFVPLPEERSDASLFQASLLLLFLGWFVGTSLEVHFPRGFGESLFGDLFGAGYAFWICLLLFFLYLGSPVLFALFGRWWGWPKRRGLLLGAAILLALSQILVPFAASPVVMGVLLFSTGVSLAVAYCMSLYHAQAGRPDRVRRAGIHEGCLSLGSLAGPLLGGWLAEATGSLLSVPLLNGAVCLVGALLVAWLLFGRQVSKKPTAGAT